MDGAAETVSEVVDVRGDEPFAYYLVLECPKCEHDIYFGLCVTLDTHRGRPAIAIDVGATEMYDCENCGTRCYTGDLEVWA